METAPLSPGLTSATPTLGVVIVTFNSADVILDCLESLLGATGVRLAITVVDNASLDNTVATLKAWASGDTAYRWPEDVAFAHAPVAKPLTLHGAEAACLAETGHRVTLLETGVNGGFAAGVNHGLAHLAACAEVDRFWILNPDSVVPPGTAAAFATAPAGPAGFSLMGGRVIYLDGQSDTIQIDGGLIDRRFGITRNCHQHQTHAETPPPDPAALDFITGASMVASRAFYERAGPLPEEYFLYFEEVDWALKRGDLPLAYCAEGIVYHRAGTAIGSVKPGQPASPFSLYFMHRNRLRFVRRHFPGSVAGAVVYSLMKAAQFAAKGYGAGARAVLAGTFNRRPPEAIRHRLAQGPTRHAFE